MEEASSSSADRPRSDRPEIPPREFALARLARRAHSEGELAHKMTRAGYGEEDIRATLDYLRARRYVDDASFAREFARARAERRRWGPARIEQRLKSLRLSDRHIEDALAETFPDGENDAAEVALVRFLERDQRRMSRLSADQRRARAYRHLLSRGYAPEVAHELVSRRDFGDTDELQS